MIDSRNRSRFRINGVASPTTSSEIELRAQEVYPNCQQYIQKRALERVVDIDSDPNDVRCSESLSGTQREWIEEADTFFIASLHPEHGADASHRGGDPGFIEVRDDRLVFPDYSGNTLFNTLGNIAVNQNVGLLFVDFEGGTTLQLTGHADIIWDEDRIRDHDGAERLVEVALTRTIEMPHGNPLRRQLTERSPFNP